MTSLRFLIVLVTLAGLAASVEIVFAGAGQQEILDHFAELATAENAAFAGFSAARGEAFFREQHGTGNADIPSCTVCHTSSPLNQGETRVGQPIAPMAVSVTGDRFTDLAKVEKWFRRNCNTVIGRECTPQEKGDFIAFMVGQ